ncbi:MAG: hypothetical protein EOM73_17215 [Bacteroidia bacterium]|nr:hypothetical protein [Bacteroidia bacterium]
MKQIALLLIGVVGLFVLAGCGSIMKSATESASTKNLDAAGYIMAGEIETNNPETGTPQGRLIIGRLTYKSRKVGIPADQKEVFSGLDHK